MLEKRPKYVRNDVDMFEMTRICGEMAYVFDKRLKDVGIDLEILEMAKTFGKWLRFTGHPLRI